ncbi:MAG TPA: hypothetical protein VNH63_12575 [Gemmatimonadales bacterium]|nr:hypothetical protein [Gemmatimonadales bacterium]
MRWLVVLSVLACHHHRPAPQSPAGALLGTWQYRSGIARDTTRPALNAGLRFALTFDSAAGRAAYGQVSNWFAGDVGALPGTFGRVVATLDSAGTIAIVVPYARGNAAPLQFLLTLQGDTLAIRSSSSDFQTTAGAKFVRARP